MPEIRIVALGSSFAAGPNIPPIENEAAGRSCRNYAHQLAAKIQDSSPGSKVTLTDLTVSGATILNVLEESQQAGGVVFPPQLHGVPPNADIVTFTCGGNDIKYIGGLMHDSMVATLGRSHPMVSGSEAACAPALKPEELIERIKRTLVEINRRAPQARVYLVQYLALIGDCTRPLYDLPLSAAKLHHYDENVAKLLAQAYYSAAEHCPWAEVVPVAELSRSHALGSKQPWVRGFPPDIEKYLCGPSPYHPTLLGHTAVAEMIYRQMLETFINL